MKFPLREEQAPKVIEWMRDHLDPDPHGGGTHHDAYLVQSVYLDTPAFDVFHRRESFARAKFRIRRYGDDTRVFLERKLKRGGVVRKRRQPISADELFHLNGSGNGQAWPGSWFKQRIELRRLNPVIRMCYERLARLGNSPEGRFRVTLDRELRAQRIGDYVPPQRLDSPDLLQGGAVLEVKFVEVLPGIMRQLVEEFHLGAGPLSKYRLGVRACGLVPVSTGPESDGEPASATLHV